VNGGITANGTDIYGDGHITRGVWGSGGERLARQLGGATRRYLRQGFALTPKEIAPNLDALAAGDQPFDHANYRCAA
jgi:hypothetical protein